MKKKLIFITTFFLLTFQANADSSIKINDLDMDYQQGQGELQASTFEYNSFDLSFKTNDLAINVENNKDSDRVIIRSEKSQLEFESSLLKALANLPSILVKGLSLEYIDKSYTGSFEEVVFRDKESLSLSDTTFTCSRTEERALTEDLIKSCTSKGLIEIGKINLNASSSLAFGKIIKSRTVKEFNNIRLHIENKLFHFSMWFKKWKDMNIRSWGRVSFDQQENVVIMTVQKIKLGSFTITRSALGMLKEHETEKFKVELNVLYIYL